MKYTIATAFALALAASPAWSIDPNSKGNGETVNLQVISGALANLPGIIAQRKGFCEKHNLHCELKTINAAATAMQALIGKSIDVAIPVADVVAANVAEGGDLVIAAMSHGNNHLAAVVRSDVPMPNMSAGYPSVMQDFKGKKIGVTGRGSGGEIQFNAMLAGAGMSPSDVTYVPVGGPSTAYQALTVGKQVDALMLFQPVQALCEIAKTCVVAVDLTKGEGPAVIRAMNGAMLPMAMRRAMVESNPQLVRALLAALIEAATWAKDPANFDEVVGLLSPMLTFGEMPNADELRKTLIRAGIAGMPDGLKTNREAVRAVVDFAAANKLISKPVDPEKLVWVEAP